MTATEVAGALHPHSYKLGALCAFSVVIADRINTPQNSVNINCRHEVIINRNVVVSVIYKNFFNSQLP